MSIIKANSFQNLAGSTLHNVVQVAHHAHDPGNTTTTSSTLVDTGLTVTLTPRFSNSRFLLIASMTEVYLDGSNRAIGFAFNRNGTVIGDHNLATIGYNQGGYTYFNYNQMFYDAPNTGSALTYKVQYKSHYGTSVQIHADSTASYLTVMEIAQ
jgi:hypothetical protein